MDAKENNLVNQVSVDALSIEELKKKVKELTKELNKEKELTKAYRDDADCYRKWWNRETNKINEMKEDFDLINKLTEKLMGKW